MFERNFSPLRRCPSPSLRRPSLFQSSLRHQSNTPSSKDQSQRDVVLRGRFASSYIDMFFFSNIQESYVSLYLERRKKRSL